jgi:phage tail-like protein
MPDTEAVAAPGAVADPLRSYRFLVDVQGFGNARFTGVSGMGVEVEAIKHREGGVPTPRFLPGQVNLAAITFSYGLTENDLMWDWLMAAARGEVDRREVSIVMLDPTGVNQQLRWNLTRAWPTKWSGAPLDAMGGSLAIESLTIVYEGIERDTAGAPSNSTPPGAPGK